jgi:hypothetical protein
MENRGVADAEELALKSIKARKKVFGHEHIGTLSGMAMLGHAYDLEGRWDKVAGFGK